jgi:hypothetical protein
MFSSYLKRLLEIFFVKINILRVSLATLAETHVGLLVKLSLKLSDLSENLNYSISFHKNVMQLI